MFDPIKHGFAGGLFNYMRQELGVMGGKRLASCLAEMKLSAEEIYSHAAASIKVDLL